MQIGFTDSSSSFQSIRKMEQEVERGESNVRERERT